MFGFLYTGLELIYSAVSWLIGFNQRQIGRQEQQNDDKSKTIKVLDQELAAAVARPSDAELSDELRHGKF